MAKLEDVVAQLQAVVPKFTDKFNETVEITDLLLISGDTYKATAVAHGLANTNVANLRGILMVNPITAVAIADGIVTATTQFDHDLTEGFTENVNLSGFGNVADGDYPLLSVPETNKFTFAAASLPTGSGNLNEDRIDGLNGRFVVSDVQTDTFQFTAPDNAFTAFLLQATSVVETTIRISAVAAVDRVANYYSKQELNNFWAFVVNEDSATSHDRDVASDANQRNERGDEIRFEIIQLFTVYVFAPTKDSFGGRLVSDVMTEEIRAALCRSLVGVKFDSGFATEPTRFGTMFNGDGFFSYVGAYYVHRFTFETVYNFNPEDAVDLPDSRAFRRFVVDLKLPFDNYTTKKTTIEGDLP